MKNKYLLLLWLLISLNIVSFYLFLNYRDKYNDSIDREQVYKTQEESEIRIKDSYYLSGKNQKWELHDGYLLLSADKTFFINGDLEYIGDDELELTTYNISLQERNTENEVVSYICGTATSIISNRIGNTTHSYHKKLKKGNYLGVFRRWEPSLLPVQYQYSESTKLVLVLRYNDMEGEEYTEEIEVDIAPLFWEE